MRTGVSGFSEGFDAVVDIEETEADEPVEMTNGDCVFWFDE
jgi:hypothetical protein